MRSSLIPRKSKIIRRRNGWMIQYRQKTLTNLNHRIQKIFYYNIFYSYTQYNNMFLISKLIRYLFYCHIVVFSRVKFYKIDMDELQRVIRMEISP